MSVSTWIPGRCFAPGKDMSIKNLHLKSEIWENFLEISYPKAHLSLSWTVLCFIYANDWLSSQLNAFLSTDISHLLVTQAPIPRVICPAYPTFSNPICLPSHTTLAWMTSLLLGCCGRFSMSLNMLCTTYIPPGNFQETQGSVPQ